MKIVLDDLSGKEIARFLEEHIEDMKSTSPPESKHALDLEGLKSPEVSFWSVYDDGCLVACGAIKELDIFHGEIKSMRTTTAVRGKGFASKLLRHILDTAKSRGYKTVSLETGSMAFFAHARKLYINHGFQICRPFGHYKEDPNSVFMSKEL